MATRRIPVFDFDNDITKAVPVRACTALMYVDRYFGGNPFELETTIPKLRALLESIKAPIKYDTHIVEFVQPSVFLTVATIVGADVDKTAEYLVIELNRSTNTPTKLATAQKGMADIEQWLAWYRAIDWLDVQTG